MTAFYKRHRVRKSSLFVIFLFLVAVAHSEIPEDIRLCDDVSNDIAFTGSHSDQPRLVDEEGVPPLASGHVVIAPVETVAYFLVFSTAGPSPLLGQERLVLWSIQRI
jgi:hypothetical protein